MNMAKLRRHPVESANIISRLFFWWTLPLFRNGSKRDLSMDDLSAPLVADESQVLGDRLEAEWNVELEKLNKVEYKIDSSGNKVKKSAEPSLTRAIVRAFWLNYVSSTVFSFLQFVVLRTIQPLLQSSVVSYFGVGHDASSQAEVLCYATALVVTIVGSTFIVHHVNLDTQRIGMQVRVACSALLYRKSLKLSRASLNRTTPGQVINLLSNDVSRFDLLPMFLYFIWIMPIQLIVVGCCMWRSIGVSTLIGIATLLLMAIPLQAYISKRGGQLRGIIARLTDRRVQLMNELVNGIQVIKTYAWEKPFNKVVSLIRSDEINRIRQSSYFRALYLALMVFSERTTLFFALVSFVLMKNTVTAEITFELASYFNVFQLVCTIMFPQALILCGEALISIHRLQNFLLLEEIDYPSYNATAISENSHFETNNTIKSPVSVELRQVSANWVTGQLPPTICNVNLQIKGGQLCTLVGSVASGKSSILNLLLNELPLGAGSVRLLQYTSEKFLESQIIHGFIKDNPNMKISFASQDAWLFSGTVRENILFGQPYDRLRYQEVTKVCSLLRDFKQLPDGDMTTVGERGSSLSGGQRARVNLARAIYRQADLYLLDDPLSAVDARVARRLFKDCIVDFLKGKTRILVTHQLHFLKEADIIVALENGSVKYQGTFDYLSNSQKDFNEMLSQLEENHTADSELEDPESSDIIESLNAVAGVEFFPKNALDHRLNDRNIKLRRSSKLTSGRPSVRSIESYSFASDAENAAAEANSRGEEEAMSSGRLSIKVYLRYFRAGSRLCTLLCLTLIFLLGQVATTGLDYWLSYWTNIEVIRTSLQTSQGNTTSGIEEYLAVVNDSMFNYFSALDEDGLISTTNAIYIYTFCLVICIIFILMRSFMFMKVCMNASKKLHVVMFSNVLQAPMYFFNTNSAGSVLNRFSKDTGAMDELLPRTMLESLQIFLVLVSILVMIMSVNCWMFIPIIVVAIAFHFVRNFFLSTAQDIKRLEGIAKSPVFSHVAATMNGLTTIRSRGADVQVMLRKEFDSYQDGHTSAWYMILATASAFGLMLDLISCVFIACVCFSIILMDDGKTLSGSVGLAISQSLILTGMLQYGVRQSTEVQSQMTAVERILQYTDLTQEGTLSAKPSPPNWPSLGRIQFKNVFMSYKEGEPSVLKDLNFTIEAGWKVGVVGRTGAGKSSLIQALFLLTGEGLQGEILIDGRDIKTVHLQDLRSSISIIPQEPVLFSQSLRYNLDPFGKYTDDVLWNVLKEVELTGVTLDQMVTEGGTNFSVGQRQLICLARAILRNNHILVLDEATANIDSRTDELIQRTIRTKFSKCTVITIAHRLNTIIDSDRVLVMDGGHMVEYDSPFELLSRKPTTQFAKMIEETGSEMANKLWGMASSCHHTSTRSSSPAISLHLSDNESDTVTI